jgi:hypothetical protein
VRLPGLVELLLQLLDGHSVASRIGRRMASQQSSEQVSDDANRSSDGDDRQHAVAL